jgi:hypothetical protein
VYTNKKTKNKKKEINTPVKSVQEEISKILHTWKKEAREKVDKSAAELMKAESTATVNSDLLIMK